MKSFTKRILRLAKLLHAFTLVLGVLESERDG